MAAAAAAVAARGVQWRGVRGSDSAQVIERERPAGTADATARSGVAAGAVIERDRPGCDAGRARGEPGKPPPRRGLIVAASVESCCFFS